MIKVKYVNDTKDLQYNKDHIDKKDMEHNKEKEYNKHRDQIKNGDRNDSLYHREKGVITMTYKF